MYILDTHSLYRNITVGVKTKIFFQLYNTFVFDIFFTTVFGINFGCVPYFYFAKRNIKQ